MSKKIIIPNSLKQIKRLTNLVDGFLIGINDLSVNTPVNFSIEELKQIIKENPNKDIFINLNKNMHMNDLILLESTLFELDKLNITGICYYDISIVNLKQKLNLKIDLVWSAEHLTTNYNTINYWNKNGVAYTYLSSEITLEEILEIKKNTTSKLLVNVLGYLPMYTSYRHVVKNYYDKFNIKVKLNELNYMEKENSIYPIMENKLGSTIYSSKILNALDESIILKTNEINYLVFNSFNINDDIFYEIINIFNQINEKNKNELNEALSKLIPNNDKGFLYKETVFKVKKND